MHTFTRSFIVAPILSLALGAAACGGDDVGAAPDAFVPSADAMPREVVTDNRLLVVDEIAEAILAGGPGDYARIVATVPSASLDWNIHGHANGMTQIVDEAFNVMSMDYLFAPTAEADWYLLLRNKGQTDTTVDLRIELYGDMTWSGWQ